MFETFKSLLSKNDKLQPDEYTVYTVHEGKEYVSHDGLGLMTQGPTDLGDGSDTVPMQKYPDWQKISGSGCMGMNGTIGSSIGMDDNTGIGTGRPDDSETAS